jgi:hypothetical protein
VASWWAHGSRQDKNPLLPTKDGEVGEVSLLHMSGRRVQKNLTWRVRLPSRKFHLPPMLFLMLVMEGTTLGE